MKVTMMIAITKPGGGIENVHREVDLPFVPNIGMGIWCAIWDSKRKVGNVTLNLDPDDYEVESLCLDMGMIETKNENEQQQHVELHKKDGWTLAGE